MWDVDYIKSKNPIYPAIEHRVCLDEEYLATLVRHKVGNIWCLSAVTGDQFPLGGKKLENSFLFKQQKEKVNRIAQRIIKGNKMTNFTIHDNNQND